MMQTLKHARLLQRHARRLLAAGLAAVLLAPPGWAAADNRSAAAKAESDAAAAERAGRDARRSGSVQSASLQKAGEAMQKVGEARLKVLLWSVYDSRLYTPSGSYTDGVRPLRLEIQYLRDVSAQALLERTLAEWEAMGRSHPDQQSWLEELAGIWPDISSNDILTLALDRDSVATFLHNGRLLGTIEDPEFGQQFIDIWLSRDSTRPELRLALLGRDSGD